MRFNKVKRCGIKALAIMEVNNVPSQVCDRYIVSPAKRESRAFFSASTLLILNPKLQKSIYL